MQLTNIMIFTVYVCSTMPHWVCLYIVYIRPSRMFIFLVKVHALPDKTCIVYRYYNTMDSLWHSHLSV